MITVMLDQRSQEPSGGGLNIGIVQTKPGEAAGCAAAADAAGA